MVFSSELETNPHMAIADLIFLGSKESLYLCVTNGVTRSRAILKKYYSFLSSSQVDLCACCVRI